MSRAGVIVEATFPAVAASVPLIRSAVTAAALDAGATPQQIDAARLAVTEAATNVVLHAYDATAGSIHVSVSVIDDELQIVISDDGFGIRPRTDSPGIGAGMAIIARSCTRLEVGKSESGGSRLLMRFALQPAPSPPESSREEPWREDPWREEPEHEQPHRVSSRFRRRDHAGSRRH
jgi:anti-sigma regulatory factor (Ser/Thr protein kinase)